MNQRGSQQVDVAGKDPISLCNLQTNLEIVLNPKKESELPKFPRNGIGSSVAVVRTGVFSSSRLFSVSDFEFS